MLRVITAVMLGYRGYSLREGPPDSAFGFARVIAALLLVIGLCMIVGFATLISGVLSCVLLLAAFDWAHLSWDALPAIGAGLSLVLLLLGPGAYSLDARLLGLRRIKITPRKPKP